MTTHDSGELHVIFGTGTLGKWTGRELVKLGKRVRFVNRSGKAFDLPEGAELVASDAYDPAKTTEVVQGAAAIYQCAQPEYHEWETKFMPLQDSIMAAAITTGAKLIAAENVYMYGAPNGKPLTEDTPYNAHTRKGKVRQAMTEKLFAQHKAGNLRAASVRGSDFFGPDDMSNTKFIVYAAVQGKAAQMVGRGDRLHSFTYTPDFGKLLAIAGTRDEALGQAWHVPNNPPLTQNELLSLFEAELGTPIKRMYGTTLVMRAMGLFVPAMREMVEMMYEFNHPFVVDGSKAERTFGITATPMKQMISETVAWVKTHLAQLAAAH
ncbi:MAG: NAD(P)H-binding protein [Anaerolineae bacterium]